MSEILEPLELDEILEVPQPLSITEFILSNGVLVRPPISPDIPLSVDNFEISLADLARFLGINSGVLAKSLLGTIRMFGNYSDRIDNRDRKFLKFTPAGIIALEKAIEKREKEKSSKVAKGVSTTTAKTLDINNGMERYGLEEIQNLLAPNNIEAQKVITSYWLQTTKNSISWFASRKKWGRAVWVLEAKFLPDFKEGLARFIRISGKLTKELQDEAEKTGL